MLYSEFKDKKISMLGYGGMRFPVLDGDRAKIDMEKAAELIDFAMKNGVNYYDTAYMYHGGNSETALGEILSKYPRDSFFLADKFPGFEPENAGDVERIFEDQLEKCKTEYFDFYLFHNVCEESLGIYTSEEYGIFDYLYEQKKKGRIKHLGFSSHARYDALEKFLEKYGEYMEFCQLQINWFDWVNQNVPARLELLKKHSIPVWIMEPVRGGKLMNLTKEHEERLKALQSDYTNARWAFEFVKNIENVKVILSGMSNMEQVSENVRIFSKKTVMTDEEKSVLSDIAAEMIKNSKIGCTACSYCTSKCPMKLDIPRLINVYNENVITGGGTACAEDFEGIDKDKLADKCLGCKSCEAVCPQQIEISAVMKKLNDHTAI